MGWKFCFISDKVYMNRYIWNGVIKVVQQTSASELIHMFYKYAMNNLFYVIYFDSHFFRTLKKK